MHSPHSDHPDSHSNSGAEFQRLIAALSIRMASGDHLAVTELYQRLTPGLTRHFHRKLGVTSGTPGSPLNGDLAEELVQRTWIEFWKTIQAGTYDATRGRYSTFLYAIAANIWLRSLRERGRKRESPLPDGDEWLAADERDDPARAVDLAEAIEAVRQVVNGLDPSAPFTDQERDILRAVAADRTEREIADQLGVSPSTAHERKRALLTRFADFLRGRGIDCSKNVRAIGTSSGEQQVKAPILGRRNIKAT